MEDIRQVYKDAHNFERISDLCMDYALESKRDNADINFLNETFVELVRKICDGYDYTEEFVESHVNRLRNPPEGNSDLI